MKELKELIDLYIKSNTYDTKIGPYTLPLTDIKIPVSELKKILDREEKLK